MTSSHSFAISPRDFRARFDFQRLALEKGVGTPGRSMHPQPGGQQKNATPDQSPQIHRNNPAFRTRMVLTVSFVISPAIGLSCHRRFAGLLHPAKLDASVEASGPYDFAVRVTRPRLKRDPRPPHPAPRP